MQVARFEDVMAGHDRVEIVCLYKDEVVRTLDLVTDSTIRMECPNGESVDVEPDTPLTYEPWHMDRGSICFNGRMKLCTEMDIARYPDGTEESIEPADSVAHPPAPSPEDIGKARDANVAMYRAAIANMETK